MSEDNISTTAQELREELTTIQQILDKTNHELNVLKFEAGEKATNMREYLTELRLVREVVYDSLTNTEKMRKNLEKERKELEEQVDEILKEVKDKKKTIQKKYDQWASMEEKELKQAEKIRDNKVGSANKQLETQTKDIERSRDEKTKDAKNIHNKVIEAAGATLQELEKTYAKLKKDLETKKKKGQEFGNIQFRINEISGQLVSSKQQFEESTRENNEKLFILLNEINSEADGVLDEALQKANSIIETARKEYLKLEEIYQKEKEERIKTDNEINRKNDKEAKEKIQELRDEFEQQRKQKMVKEQEELAIAARSLKQKLLTLTDTI